jgi:hypothetical protein
VTYSPTNIKTGAVDLAKQFLSEPTQEMVELRKTGVPCFDGSPHQFYIED